MSILEMKLIILLTLKIYKSQRTKNLSRRKGSITLTVLRATNITAHRRQSLHDKSTCTLGNSRILSRIWGHNSRASSIKTTSAWAMMRKAPESLMIEVRRQMWRVYERENNVRCVILTVVFSTQNFDTNSILSTHSTNSQHGYWCNN